MSLDLPANCERIFELASPSTIYESLFLPSRIQSFNGGVKDWILKGASSIFPHKIAVINQLPEPIPSRLMDIFFSNYVVLSPVQWACYCLVEGAVYRSCQLLANAVEHKIEQQKWHPVVKFCMTGSVALLPLGLLYLLDMDATTITLIYLAKLGARGLLPLRQSNMVKELNLIVTNRKFTLPNFINQNIVTFVINVMSIEAYNLLLGGRDQYGPSFFCGSTLLESNITAFELSAHNLEKTYLDIFLNEFGWVLGKLTVDVLFILLAHANIVRDLRIPINSISFRPQKTHPIFNRPMGDTIEQHVPHTHQDTKKQVLRQEEPSVQSAAYMQSTAIQHPTKTQSRRSKKNIAASSSQASTSTVVEKPREIQRSKISIPGSVSGAFLVPLSHAIEGLPKNTWGIITCAGPSDILELHAKSLASSGYVKIGGQGSIKGLGTNKFGQMIYEIRPRNTGTRILGIARRGEQEIERVFKSHFDLNVSIELIGQMMGADQDEEIALVEFNHYVGKHLDDVALEMDEVQ